jgi:hypothetical protein
MGITKLVGIYLSAAYDFTVDGYTTVNESTGIPADVSQVDDVDHGGALPLPVLGHLQWVGEHDLLRARLAAHQLHHPAIEDVHRR